MSWLCREDCCRALVDAICQCDLELVKRCFEKCKTKLDEDTFDNSYLKRSMLRKAMKNLPILRFLLNQFKRQKDQVIRNPIDYGCILESASENGYLPVVRILFEETDVDIHVRNDSAIRVSSTYGHADVVEFLIGKGANIHAYFDEAFADALVNKHFDVAEVLFSHGACIKDSLHLCLMRGEMKIINEDLKITEFLETHKDGLVSFFYGLKKEKGSLGRFVNSWAFDKNVFKLISQFSVTCLRT